MEIENIHTHKHYSVFYESNFMAKILLSSANHCLLNNASIPSLSPPSSVYKFRILNLSSVKKTKPIEYLHYNQLFIIPYTNIQH